MSSSCPSPTISCFGYRNVQEAIEWLCHTLGYREHQICRDGNGTIVHAELTYGKGMIMVGPDRAGEFGKRFMTMPGDIGGRCTQVVYMVVDDIDAHYAHAKACGADIVMPLEVQDYGGKNYGVRDLEGHIWSIGDYDPWHHGK